jgi:organic radical activating enzyme
VDTRRVIPKLEFYITNVCNLSCEGCNRFNDIHFKGHQLWKDYDDIIRRWAEKIKIEHIVIMGGEPFLNPSISDWISGLSKYFNTNVQVMSNGTYITRVPGLYDLLRTTKSWIGISIHEESLRETIYQNIRNFFPANVQENTVDPIAGGERSFYDGKVRIETWNYTHFTKNALKSTEEGRYTLHDNPPEAAFQICAFQQHKNYHFIRGKIYRCGPVALFPELDNQFDLDLSLEDKALIRAYRPLSIDEYDSRAEDFFAHIDDMIPQCKFCSADDTYHELKFVAQKRKKIDIQSL